MSYIPKDKLPESIQQAVNRQLTPMIKKFIGNNRDLPRKNSPTFTPHTFEDFEDQEFYSREEVQKKIISKYYSEEQVEQMLNAIENNLKKGFSEYISASSVPIDKIKKSTFTSRNE